MAIREILDNVTSFFTENVKPPFKITAVEYIGNNEEVSDVKWKATVEVIEEKEYMKKYAKDEMLGVYNVLLNENEEVISYKRESIRYRSKIDSN